MRGNTIRITLVKGRQNRTEPLFQYDYGQIMFLDGVELPTYYEVHFSNTEHGESKTSVGDVDGVVIPDEYLETGKNVYWWLFLHDGEDDGETEYYGVIPINKRSEPSDTPPTPAQESVITQTIAAANAALEEAESIVTDIKGQIDSALQEAKESGEFDGPPGTDGFSPTATVTKSGNVATISITDKNGTTTTEVNDGAAGQPGPTPQLSIGTVQTLQPGSDATVTISGTAANPVLNFGIPQGADGDLSSSDLATTAETQEIITEYWG